MWKARLFDVGPAPYAATGHEDGRECHLVVTLVRTSSCGERADEIRGHALKSRQLMQTLALKSAGKG